MDTLSRTTSAVPLDVNDSQSTWAA